MARIALSIVGAVAGFVLTGFNPLGAKLGWMAGSLAGAFLFPPHGQNVHNVGPRQQDLQVTSSAYGSPITIGWGTERVNGNIIQSTGIIETQHDDTQTVGGASGGGQTTTNTTFTYSASFAISWCKGPAFDILRIWADGKLIYDKTGATAGLTSLPMVFYTGSEDQLPDPTLQSLVGAENCPAYRGLCYSVFTNAPLANFGNRIPNLTAEIVFTEGEQVFPSVGIPATDFPYGLSTDLITRDPNRPYIYTFHGALGVSRINANTNEVEQSATYGPAIPGGWSSVIPVIDSDGFIYAMTEDGNFGHLLKIDGLTLGIVAESSSMQSNAFGGGLNLLDHPVLGPIVVYNAALFGSKMYFMKRTDLSQFAWSPISPVFAGKMVQDNAGNIWMVGINSGSASIAKIHLSANTTSVDYFDISADCPSSGAHNGIMYYAADNSLIIAWTTPSGTEDGLLPICNGFIKWDIATTQRIAFIDSLPGGGLIGAYSDSGFNNTLSDGIILCFNGSAFHKVLASNLTLINTYQVSDYGLGGGLFGFVWDPNSDSAYLTTSGGVVQVMFDRANASAVTLDVVVSDLSVMAGLTTADIDVTELAIYTVHGYAISRQMPVRSAVEPLAQAYFFDGVETDNKVKFFLRGRTPVATITEDEMGLKTGDTPEPRLTENRTQEVDLPRRVDVLYIDHDASYQQGDQHAKRIQATMASQEPVTLDFPIVFTKDEAKQIAEKSLYLSWVQRNAYDFKLLPKWLRLDPTDVVLLNYHDVLFKVRLVRIDVGTGFGLAVQAISEDEFVYLSNAVGAVIGAGSPPNVVVIPGQTELILMDTPLLRDIDQNDAVSGVYVALGAYQADWPGAVVYRSPDNVNWGNFTSSNSAATWGRGVAALPPPDSPHLWDEDNELVVALSTKQFSPTGLGGDGGTSDPGTDASFGGLQSSTDLEVLNGANVAYYDGEIIQFVNAVQNADGTYTLSRLLRGRRGTEDKCSGHVPSGVFVLLSASTVIHKQFTVADVGALRYYKAVTIGALFSATATKTLTSSGDDLKPYSPCSIEGARDGSNNLTITWIRRTRVGGPWIDGTGTVPLSEATESYEVDILNGGNVVRTITGLTTPTASYTAAQQTTDFGSPQLSLDVKVYQMGTLGRGKPGVATI